MNNGRLRVLIGLAMAWGMIGVQPLWAEPVNEAHGPANGRRAVLVLSPPRDPSLQLQFRQAVAAELGELQVQVQWVQPSPANLDRAVDRAARLARERRAAAVVWLETADDGWLIFLYESSGPYLRQRFIPVTSVSSGPDEVALVLRSALTAILEGGETGMSEVVISAGEPDTGERCPSGPPAEAHSDPLLSAGLGYAGALYAREAPWQHGAVVSLQLRPWRGPAYLGVSYTFFSPVRLEGAVSGSHVSTQLVRRPTELILGGEISGGTLRWGPEIGLMLDAIQRESLNVGEPLSATESTRRWQMALSLRLRGTWMVGGGVGISSSLGADLPTTRLDHVAEGEENTASLARQLSVRPRAEVGAFIRLW